MSTKNLLTLFIFLLFTSITFGQSATYNKGIGVRAIAMNRFGTGAALDYKSILKGTGFLAPICDKVAFEAFASAIGYVIIGESRFSSEISAFIEPHKKIMDFGLSWYWGVGASVGLTNGKDYTGSYTSPYFGPKVIGGFEYILPKHPWAFTLGWIAGYDYVPGWAMPSVVQFQGTASAIFLFDTK